MESLNHANQEFFKKNYADKNVDVDVANNIVQDISNDSASKILNSPNFCSNKILKSEEYCPDYQCDKVSSVFVDVGNDLVGSDYLLEEDDDICKVSNEDHEDIDYHLVNVENVYENPDSYDKNTNINVNFTRSLNVVSISGGFKKVNANVIDSDIVGDVSVFQSPQEINPKIKQEIMVDEEVSLVNESIIDIELQSVSKTEEVLDTGENNMPIVDGSCSHNMLDNSNEEIEIKNVFIVDKPLKVTETVQREMENNLQLQNEVQTLQSDLQIKLETDSRDCRDGDKQEESVKKLGEEVENIEVEGINEMCQYFRKEKKSKRTPDRRYVCEVCSKGFTKLSNLKQHKQIHTGDRPFSCNICNKSFITLACLKRHKLIHNEDKTFGCSVCGKVFAQLDTLKVHKRIHTGDRPFGCSVCGKAFRYLSNLQVHKVIHTGDKPFVCSVCGKAFTHLATLKNHKSIHTGERPFGCTICGKAFKQLSALNGHKVTHTGDKPYSCGICEKSFTLLSNLQRHNLIHTGSKPYSCSICGKAFRQHSTLKTHESLHTGDRPFGCTICGKAFTQQSALRGHKRIHTGDRPFACSICGKTFTQQTSLKTHKMMHTGDRPFGCSLCGKAFIQMTHLNKHRCIHTGERQFACSICGKVFTRNTSLQRHICGVHSREKPMV